MQRPVPVNPDSVSFNLDTILNAAAEIWKASHHSTIWLLDAPMGAGKTTFTKALLGYLGSIADVSSPTFGLVHEYELKHGKSVYHFDLYRVTSLDELEQIGIWDYLDSGNLCLIEWPQILKPALTALDYNWFELKIEPTSASQRTIWYWHNQ